MNRIVQEKLTILGNLVVKGTLFLATQESDLEMIDDLESYTPISGKYDNLTIEGDLLVCDYKENCIVTINGAQGNNDYTIGTWPKPEPEPEPEIEPEIEPWNI